MVINHLQTGMILFVYTTSRDGCPPYLNVWVTPDNEPRIQTFGGEMIFHADRFWLLQSRWKRLKQMHRLLFCLWIQVFLLLWGCVFCVTWGEEYHRDGIQVVMRWAGVGSLNLKGKSTKDLDGWSYPPWKLAWQWKKQPFGRCFSY